MANDYETAGKRAEGSHKGFEIDWIGRLQKVHRDGDARPNINLLDIEGPDGLFAIGPLAGLRGEITVVDGSAFIARVEGNTISVSGDFNVEAPFLVYGIVEDWKEWPIPVSVRTIEEFEKWLPTAAQKAGIDADTEAFPFKVASSTSVIDYHVISNREPGYLVTRPHNELMCRFQSHSNQLTMLGVFSKSHAGVFTHRNQWTHIHVVCVDPLFSGHVDSFVLGPDALLYLPMN